MSAIFLKLARTVLFPSSSPISFRLRMISSMVVLGPHGEVVKALPVSRLAQHKLLVSADAVVGLELLAKTHIAKHMATGLANLVIVRRWQQL